MSQINLNVEEYKAFSTEIAKAYKVAKSIPRRGERVPQELTDPSYVFLIISMGRELGMKPLQALQNISLIDGKPVLWGDGMLAVVRNSGELESFNESMSNTSFDETKMTRKQLAGEIYTDDFCAVCKVKRKGYEEKTYKFSVSDAKIASLWCFTTDTKGKQYTPWYKYPKRMLQMRARSWALRDTFADHLAGFSTVEEARDIHQQYDTVEDTTPVEVTTPVETTPVRITPELIKPPAIEKDVELKDPKDENRDIAPEIEEYVKEVAKKTNRTTNEVRKRANANFESFYGSYKDWADTK